MFLKVVLFSAICSLGFVKICDGGLTGRIVGGVDANPGDFPHQISLRRNNSHICGGSVISNRFVLTAAHCVVYEGLLPYPPSYFTIRAGSVNRLAGGVLVGVQRIIVNENYGDFLNDVALLELSDALVFTKYIKSIKLASKEVPENKPVTISGWGRIRTNGQVPVILQHNTLNAISKSRCQESIGMSSDTLICLAHQPNNGACNGDSGGPATYLDELVGVAGFVIERCGTAYPDGYAKVFFHVNWIKKETGIN